MTEPDILEAARWLAALRNRFGLSPKQACTAIREATLLNARAT